MLSKIRNMLHKLVGYWSFQTMDIGQDSIKRFKC